jgi:uncharacterized protein (TIGR01777 family)
MKITLTGASGFLGRRLIERLQQDGHTLHVLGRSRPKAAGVSFTAWDAVRDAVPVEAVEGADAVIHLAGEPVAQRWTSEVKDRIRTSRVNGSEALVRAIGAAGQRPRVMVAASAIGYYGERGDAVVTEATPAGQGFLPDISVAWERAADGALAHGVRVVKLRLGIVLGPDGGALDKMLPPFRMGVGGVIGNGAQWMSWIHVDDVIGLLVYCLAHAEVQGAVNATAPRPVQNKEFTHALGVALHRPTIFPVPPLALKLLYGEMASMVLASQRVEPVAALRAGYAFAYPELQPALNQLLR